MNQDEIEEDYSPYCKLCTSCNEEGCCSYLMCVNKVLDNNKDCSYNTTTKFQIYLRDIFIERIFLSNLNKEDLDRIYSDSWNEAKKLTHDL